MQLKEIGFEVEKGMSMNKVFKKNDLREYTIYAIRRHNEDHSIFIDLDCEEHYLTDNYGNTVFDITPYILDLIALGYVVVVE